MKTDFQSLLFLKLFIKIRSFICMGHTINHDNSNVYMKYQRHDVRMFSYNQYISNVITQTNWDKYQPIL